jgi:hypothetical protein
VGQVELVARNVQAEQIYEVTWPPTASSGAVRKITGEFVAGSEKEARLLAQWQYNRARAVERCEVITSAITDEWCRPGTLSHITWDFDVSDTHWALKPMLCLSIDVELTIGHPKSYSETVQMVEYIA